MVDNLIGRIRSEGLEDCYTLGILGVGVDVDEELTGWARGLEEDRPFKIGLSFVGVCAHIILKIGWASLDLISEVSL